MTTRIRPLEGGDLSAVAALYARVVRAEDAAPPGLADYIRRLCLEHPWADPAIPALVARDDRNRVVGFLGSYPRRMRLDGRPVRLACSGSLVADPDHPGIGALLTRTYLTGQQDATITDGGTELMYRIWTGLGGQARVSASLGWYRVIRPASTLTALLGRGRRVPAGVPALARTADAAVGRISTLRTRWAVPSTDTVAVELTVEALLEQMSVAPRRWRLHPDYDAAYLHWLFGELEAVDVRGPAVRHLVRDRAGRVLGWYVYFRPPGGVAEVLQLVAPAHDVGAVFDHLVADAAGGGATAVHGRLEPALADVVRARRCLIRPTAWALVDGPDAVRGLLASNDSLLTRLDGEWWMGHHLLWREGGRS